MRRPALRAAGPRGRATTVLAVMLVTSLGCSPINDLLGRERNPAFCPAHPEDLECRLPVDAPPDTPDTPTTCRANTDCSAPLGVCDLSGTMMCVPCTATDNPCAASTPVCAANQCEKCTAHAQCAASDVCLPDGSCADATAVAYLRADGAGTTCTKELPCNTLAKGLATGHSTVKIAAGTISDNQTTSLDGRVVAIFADAGAKLDREGNGTLLTVTNGADVKIFDLEIGGATGNATDVTISVVGGAPKLSLTRVVVRDNQGIGLSIAAGSVDVTQSRFVGNAGGGIALAAGLLTLARSTVDGNTAGGVKISGGEFAITNNFIVENGAPGSILGGVRIDGVAAVGTHVFEFNTLTGNTGGMNVNTGIDCLSVLGPVTLSSNIVYDNQVRGAGAQIGGSPSCAIAYSDVGPMAVTAPGVGNLNGDPKFVNPALHDYRLKPDSPARDTANPTATLGVDFEGDVRPQGARRDMGADEVTP